MENLSQVNLQRRRSAQIHLTQPRLTFLYLEFLGGYQLKKTPCICVVSVLCLSVYAFQLNFLRFVLDLYCIWERWVTWVQPAHNLSNGFTANALQDLYCTANGNALQAVLHCKCQLCCSAGANVLQSKASYTCTSLKK